MVHQTSRLTEKTGEHTEEPNSRSEAAYQSPVPIAIFFKSLLAFLKHLKDDVGGDGLLLLEFLSKRIPRKVYSGLVGVISQGIGDPLEVRMRNRCMVSRRH